jgi:hypothetical protein
VEYDAGQPARMKEQFGSLDLVADFTYPSVPLPAVAGAVASHSAAVLAAMRPGAGFAHMSSVMAFGMGDREKFVRDRWISRTGYAANKRVGERAVARLARQHNIRLFSFRLGQVHGTLQSVTQALCHDLKWHEVFVDGEPGDATIAVFASTVAQTVNACATGTVAPGLYSLVASPQWSLETLFAYYSKRYSIDPVVRYRPTAPSSWQSAIRQRVLRNVTASRGLIEAHLLRRSEWLRRRAKGWYLQTGPAGNRDGGGSENATAQFHLLGAVPRLFTGPVDATPDRVRTGDIAIEQFLQSLGIADHV